MSFITGNDSLITDFSLSRLKQKGLLICIYAYAFLPTLLFTVMWLRTLPALILGVSLFYAIREAYIADDNLWAPDKRKESDLRLKICVVLAIITLWVLFSGIGGSIAQYPDHQYRNSMFKLLADYSWPIYTKVDTGEIRGLSYYIGFWLPSAIVYKITHSYSASFLFMQLWSVLGLAAVWYFMCEKEKKIRIWYLIAFIFFGGFDIIGYFLGMAFYSQIGNRYEWWAVIFNYPSFSTHLFWAYNQFIYALLILCLVMRQKTNKSVLLIWSASLITSTIPAVGMIPFVIYRILENTEGSLNIAKIKISLKSLLSLQNLTGLAVTAVMATFLMTNQALVNNLGNVTKGVVGAGTASADAASEAFSAYTWTTSIWMWLLFCLLEFGIYYAIIYKSEKNKKLYWLSFTVLMIIPWIRIGDKKDFCLRACIPALLILMQLIISAIHNYRSKRNYPLLAALILALMIGAGATIDTLRGSTHDTLGYMSDKKGVELEQLPSPAIFFTYRNFSSSTDTFFYKYLAKKN